eukprot:IDg2423t1
MAHSDDLLPGTCGTEAAVCVHKKMSIRQFALVLKHVPAQARSDPKYVEAVKAGMDTSGTLRYHAYRLVSTSAECGSMESLPYLSAPMLMRSGGPSRSTRPDLSAFPGRARARPQQRHCSQRVHQLGRRQTLAQRGDQARRQMRAQRVEERDLRRDRVECLQSRDAGRHGGVRGEDAADSGVQRSVAQRRGLPQRGVLRKAGQVERQLIEAVVEQAAPLEGAAYGVLAEAVKQHHGSVHARARAMQKQQGRAAVPQTGQRSDLFFVRVEQPARLVVRRGGHHVGGVRPQPLYGMNAYIYTVASFSGS